MDGLLIVDKPAGPTSHDVVERVRNILGDVRVGHSGTLDPAATGVLVLLVGRATRLSRYLKDDKEYVASVVFGASTDTDDATGRVVTQTGKVPRSSREIERACKSLEGAIEQIPPMFSAVHSGGQRLYHLARDGITVDRKARKVAVSELTLLRYRPPRADLRIRCGAGTYVRALARDLGESLECGAYLDKLRRTRVGAFGLDQAVPLEEIEGATTSTQVIARLLSCSRALKHLPKLVLSHDDCAALRSGQHLGRRAGVQVRLYALDGGFVGVGETASVKPLTMLSGDLKEL